jgi:hypothetical protein
MQSDASVIRKKTKAHHPSAMMGDGVDAKVIHSKNILA